MAGNDIIPNIDTILIFPILYYDIVSKNDPFNIYLNKILILFSGFIFKIELQ